MSADAVPPGASLPATPLPSVFVSHGAPTLALEDASARRFLQGFGATLGTPRAIVVISAHWETALVTVTGAAQHDVIHDFFGFDAALYRLRYPAPGAPALADDIVARLRDAGVAVARDDQRGLDHGAWIPLRLMYPDHDVPVVQVSICPAEDARFHFALGRLLAPLRAAGVLVMGSGALTHNLGEFRAGRRDPATLATPEYAHAFADWVAATLAAGDGEALIDWRERAPHASRAHPSDDHFLPLHVAAGAAGEPFRGDRVHQGFMFGVIAMDDYVFTPRTGRKWSSLGCA
ncbi:MAG: class III extradiol ring-cleavage dioxygenase, partial [Gammaproteobacteria bacterium]